MPTAEPSMKKQGCNENQTCLVQRTVGGTLSLSLVHSATAQQSTAPGLTDKVKGLFAQPKEDELAEPDLAFELMVVAKGTNLLNVEVVPAGAITSIRSACVFL